MIKKIVFLLLATLLFTGKTTFAMENGAAQHNGDGAGVEAVAAQHDGDGADAAEAAAVVPAWDDQVGDATVIGWARTKNTAAFEAELQKAAAKSSAIRTDGARTPIQKLQAFLAVLERSVHIRALWYKETTKSHPLEKKRSWLFWKNPWFIGKKTEEASITAAGNTIAEKIETPLRIAIAQMRSGIIGIENEAALNAQLREFGCGGLLTKGQYIRAKIGTYLHYLAIIMGILFILDGLGSIIQVRSVHYECGTLVRFTYDMLAHAYNGSQNLALATLSVPCKWLYSCGWIKTGTDYISSQSTRLLQWSSTRLGHVFHSLGTHLAPGEMVSNTTCTDMIGAASSATRLELKKACYNRCDAEGSVAKLVSNCYSYCKSLFPYFP